MEAKTFKRNTWHAQLAFHYGPLHWHTYRYGGGALDICAYTRAVLTGLIKLTFLMIGVSLFFVVPFADTLAWLVSGIVNGFTGPDFPAQFFLTLVSVILGFAVLILVGAGIKSLWEAVRRKMAKGREEAPKPDSFVTSAYKSVKGKFCFRINVVDGDDE